MKVENPKRIKRILSPKEQIDRYYREGKVEKLSPQKNPEMGEVLYLIEEVST